MKLGMPIAYDEDFEQTVDNLTLFAREVYPRLQAWKQPDAEAAAAAVAA